MLERNQSIPLYEQLKNIIESNINNGKLKANAQIPSERELGEKYKVSRITVRQAIALAEKEGLVRRVHGVGTFVSDPKIKQELNKINNFQTTVEQLGLIASTEILLSRLITSDFQLSKLLNVSMMEPVLNLQLLGLGDNSPIVFYNSFFSKDLGKFMKEKAEEMIENKMPFSTLDLYEKISAYQPTHVEQTFEALPVSDKLSEILRIDNNYPLIRVSSVVYQNESALEYKESYYKGDKYKFFITRPC